MPMNETLARVEENPINKTLARVIVLVPYKDRHGFVIVRAPDRDLWNFPGGMMEDGETEEQAAIREVEEETGLIVKTLIPCGIQMHRYCLCYVFCTYIEDVGTLKAVGDEGEEIRTVSESEFHAMGDFLPLSKVIYDMAMKKLKDMD